MVRTIHLTPAELIEIVLDKANLAITSARSRTAESVEFVTTADGVAAVVTFADKDKPAPASMPPLGGRRLTNTTQDADELEKK